MKILQYAYTVESLDAGIRSFAELLGVGPWFVRGPFVPPEGLYRGEPTDVELSLATAFDGETMLELVAQHNDAPSVYREVIDERGYGFHHWAIRTHDVDGTIAHGAARGWDVTFSDRGQNGARVVYLDARSDLPGMLEVIEHVDGQDARYAIMRRAAEHWTGGDPYYRAS